jgi:triosephosphate isomerase
MMRRPLVVANWKMNMTSPQARQFCTTLRELIEGEMTAEAVICPPYTSIETVRDSLAGSGVQVGAQDFFPKPLGAFTGQVAIEMLLALDCRYAIVGHSERRQHFQETAETISEKVRVALDHDVIPILCVGESLSERSLGLTQRVVGQQLLTGVKHLQPEELERVVIAYEPLWAIGSGRAATGQDASRVAAFVREKLDRLMNGRTELIRVLYGGSVKPENIAEFAAAPGVDGVLVGGASLDAAKFAALIRAYEVK